MAGENGSIDMTPLSERLRKAMEFDRKFKSNPHLDQASHIRARGLYDGAKELAKTRAPLDALLVKCVEAIDKSIDRADDYGDSMLSQPIRNARAELEKFLGEEK